MSIWAYVGWIIAILAVSYRLSQIPALRLAFAGLIVFLWGFAKGSAWVSRHPDIAEDFQVFELNYRNAKKHRDGVKDV